MATITNNVRFSDNAKELAANLQAGIGTLDVMRSAVDRTVASLGGTGLYGAANKITVAITELGGATKLTAAEQERASATLDKAIEKYRSMGQVAPPAMVELADSIRKVDEATQSAGASSTGFFGGMVAHIAEGMLVRDAVREILSVVKEMIVALPEMAMKGAAVAEVEESFNRLTAGAGLLGSALLGALKDGTHNTITDFELMKLVNRDLAAGLNLTDQQFGTLAQGAFALAKATGTDVTTAMETMNDAMLTGRTRSLALLTGKIDLTAAEEKYAKSIGTTVDGLSDTGKLEAARAAILDSVAGATQRLGAQTDGLDERVAQASTAWHNFEENLGKTIATSPVVMAGMDGIRDALIEAFGGKQADMVATIAKHINDLAIGVIDFGIGTTQVATVLVAAWSLIETPILAVETVIIGLVTAVGEVLLAAEKMAGKLHLVDPQEVARVKDTQVQLRAMTVSLAEQTVEAAKGVEGNSALNKSIDETGGALFTIRDRMIAASSAATVETAAVTTLSGAHDRVTTSTTKLTKAEKDREKAIADLNSASVALNATDALVVITQHALGMGEDELAKYLGVTVDQVKATVKADEERTKEATTLNDLRRSIEKTAIAESLKEYDNWAKTVSKSADDVGKHIIDGAVEIGATQKRIADETAAASLSSSDYQIVKIQEWAASAKGAFKGTADQAATFYSLIDAEAKLKIDAIGSDWQLLRTHTTESMQQTADTSAATYDYMASHADEFSASTIEKYRQIAKAAQDAADGNQHAWVNSFVAIGQAIPQLIQQAFTGGGGVAGAARAGGALVGSELGKGLVTHLTETAPEFMGSALGKVFGAAIPAIGALAGPLITAIINLFDHLGDDIARDAGQKFGTKFSDATTKAITDNVKAGMTEVAAELSSLSSIITDAGGLTGKNLPEMTARLHDVFSMIQTGQLTVAQGTKILDDNWQAFVTASTDGDGRISDSLKQIIQLNDTVGTQSKEIATFLQGQGTNALAGFAAVAAGVLTADKLAVWDDLKAKVNAAVPGSQELASAIADQASAATGAQGGLKDLGIQAVATFAAAVASGTSETDALKAIHPALASLQQAYSDLGIGTDDAALKALMMRDQIVTAAPEMINGISGLSSEMVSLSNMGLLNVDTFGAMERSGKTMYDELSAKVKDLGGTNADALAPMQTFLHNAEKAAQDLGIPLDDNTQALIDQSKQAGIWQTAITPTDKLLTGMQTLVDKVSDLVNLLLGIPPKVNTVVTTTYVTEGSPPSDQPSEPSMAATGGRVTPTGIQHYFRGGIVHAAAGGLVAGLAMGPVAWPSVGTDIVPAMLTPNERVLTVEQNKAYETLLHAPSSALTTPSSASAQSGMSTAAMEAELAGLRRDINQLVLEMPKSMVRAQRDESQGGRRR